MVRTFAQDQVFNPNDAASMANLRNPILFTATSAPVTTVDPSRYYVTFVFVAYLPAGLLSGELAAPPRNSLRPSASTRFRPTPLLVPSFA